MTHEAVYLDEVGGGFVRRPIVGVVIEEEVATSATGLVISTGVRSCNFAQQADAGSRDIHPAGSSADFVGVFPVGEEPTAELVRQARLRMAAIDERWAVAGAETRQDTWFDDGWTGSVQVTRRQDGDGDAAFTLPASAVEVLGDGQVRVTLPMRLMRWTTEPV